MNCGREEHITDAVLCAKFSVVDEGWDSPQNLHLIVLILSVLHWLGDAYNLYFVSYTGSALQYSGLCSTYLKFSFAIIYQSCSVSYLSRNEFLCFTDVHHIVHRKLWLMSSSCQYINFWTTFMYTTAEICWRVWGTPVNFNGFRVLAALLHGTLVVGVSQTAALNRGRHLYSVRRPSRALAHSNAAKTRKPLKLAGVSQTTGSISAASRPKFTILWGHLEETLLLNRFFDCRHVP